MQVSTKSGCKRCTGVGRTRVSTTSGGKRCAGGGRIQVSKTSGGKRGTGGGRTLLSTMSGCKRGTRGGRMQVSTTSSGREVPGLNKTFEMACKYVNGQYIFHQSCGLWNAPCVHGCGYIQLLSSTPGSRKKCCTNGCLSSASDNFDKELMMDHDLDKLPQFLRQIITSSPEFLKKSSTYKNLVAIAATVVCN
jgi:hypothetical protein